MTNAIDDSVTIKLQGLVQAENDASTSNTEDVYIIGATLSLP